MINSPFMQTGATKSISKGLLKSSKLTFNGIVTNLEKTISTINQVVPLYNQVRPLISNSRTLIKVFKFTKGDKNSKRKRTHSTNKVPTNTINPNIINVEVNDNLTQKEQKENTQIDIFTNIETPHKPFFI